MSRTQRTVQVRLIIPRSQVRSLPAPPHPTRSDGVHAPFRPHANDWLLLVATGCYWLLLVATGSCGSRRAILRHVRPLGCVRRRTSEGPSAEARRHLGTARVRRQGSCLQSRDVPDTDVSWWQARSRAGAGQVRAGGCWWRACST